MARIRYLKPDFFKDEDLAELSFETRLFFAGLWGLADKAGRLEDRPIRLKAEIFPYDNVDAEKCLQELSKSKKSSNKPFINRYQADGQRYIQIINWNKHQRPHHTEKNSEIPPAIQIVTDKIDAVLFYREENLFFGNIPDDLIDLSGRLTIGDNAGDWQNYVKREIEQLGYIVEKEVACPIDEDRDGRLDLVATKNDIKIAIECDYRTPRAKSIKKVKHYPMGIILLRDPSIKRKEAKEKEGMEKGMVNGKAAQSECEVKQPIDNATVTVKKAKRPFLPPTVEEVRQYIQQNPQYSNVDADTFFKFFTEGNWSDSNGKPVKNWKQKLITWSSHNGQRNRISQSVRGGQEQAGAGAGAKPANYRRPVSEPPASKYGSEI